MECLGSQGVRLYVFLLLVCNRAYYNRGLSAAVIGKAAGHGIEVGSAVAEVVGGVRGTLCKNEVEHRASRTLGSAASTKYSSTGQDSAQVVGVPARKNEVGGGAPRNRNLDTATV